MAVRGMEQLLSVGVGVLRRLPLSVIVRALGSRFNFFSLWHLVFHPSPSFLEKAALCAYCSERLSSFGAICFCHTINVSLRFSTSVESWIARKLHWLQKMFTNTSTSQTNTLPGFGTRWLVFDVVLFLLPRSLNATIPVLVVSSWMSRKRQHLIIYLVLNNW